MYKIYVDSDTLFQVTSLKNARTLTDIEDATITVELFKSDDDETQIGDDIVMDGGTGGDYYCSIPYGNNLVVGDKYFLIVTIMSGVNKLTKKLSAEAVWSD